MKCTRLSLLKRGRRYAQSWETPTHRLSAVEAENRVFGAWLQGYDAARRDMREDQRAAPRVAAPQPHDRHCLTPGHALRCLCVKCAPDLKYSNGTAVPDIMRTIIFEPQHQANLLSDDTFDPYDTKRRP